MTTHADQRAITVPTACPPHGAEVPAATTTDGLTGRGNSGAFVSI